MQVLSARLILFFYDSLFVESYTGKHNKNRKLIGLKPEKSKQKGRQEIN